jgi:hypothetical protein
MIAVGGSSRGSVEADQPSGWQLGKVERRRQPPAGNPHRLHGSRGQAIVELALLTPVLVTMVFWAFQTVTLVTDRVTAGHAVRQGARLGGQLCGSQISPGMSQAQIDGDIVKNVLAVTRTLSYATVLEIDVYRVSAADGTLQPGDLQDQFDGSGSALPTQTFTVGQRVSTPPNETSVGVRLYWRYQPPTGYQFTSLNISDRAVMRCQPILT